MLINKKKQETNLHSKSYIKTQMFYTLYSFYFIHFNLFYVRG
jgi:hypothetical protein